MRKNYLLKYGSLIIMIMMIKLGAADSGGYLMPQQAAYDVTYYDLNLTIEPESQTINGSLMMQAEIVNDLDSLVMDLDDLLSVDSILARLESGRFTKVSYLHSNGKLFIDIPFDYSIGEQIHTEVFYHGSPKISLHAPWDNGFVWGETPSGKHWVGVACETGGGDLWWPCKDHPSDEPDSMAINFTVPMEYTCVSNGQFLGSYRTDGDKMTFNWFVSTPINNYNVTFYVADFELIEGEYGSVSGKNIPFYFWVLPEAYESAQNHLPVFFNQFHFLETICGPFPFATDKHGWAHAPYWGMEHQTIIAYGNDFQVNGWGMDYIHLHELTHEWWGNLVTAKDWSDVWIHEGLGTYMEALYVEHISDQETYFSYMDRISPDDSHEFPLAPNFSMTAGEAFGYLDSYHRGAWVIHTLRFHLGDEPFFRLLKHWAYPDTSDLDNTGGRLCRLATTNDMKELAEKVTNRDLDPFFDVFMRETHYPYLEVVYKGKEVEFSWITENDVLLDLNVPVLVNDSPKIVEMDDGKGVLRLASEMDIVIDPDNWILMDEPVILSAGDPSNKQAISEFHLYQNYPNPFNPTTAIGYRLSAIGNVDLRIYNALGEKVATLVSEKQGTGEHTVEWDASGFASGLYYYTITAGEFKDVKKMILLR